MDALRNILTWLLDLDQVSLHSDRLSLQWLRPLDSWLWFIIGVGAIAFAATVYRREGGPLVARLVMAGCRTALIVLIIMLICEPAIVHHQDRKEPSIIAVMVDDSASMSQTDHYDSPQWAELTRLLAAGGNGQGTPGPAGCSRWDIVNGLVGAQSVALLPELLEHHQVRFFRFSSTASSATIIRRWPPTADSAPLTAGAPSGAATDVASSIRQVFDACVDAHLAGIVVVSDGQPTQPTGWEQVGQLSADRDTPIHIILTGSDSPPVDIAVENVRTTPNAYVGDRIACQFTVRTTGLPTDTPIDITLRDGKTDTTLASTTVHVTATGEQAAELNFEPTIAAAMVLHLAARPAESERDLDNNVAQLEIKVVENRAQVLYVEGYPRYDYRYLKNTLMRDPTIALSTLLLSADEQFAQEGDVPIRRFPATADELRDYDVVLLGDVNPQGGWITDAQLELLVQFVARDGGGLGLLAGEVHMPLRIRDTPLSILLPVEPALPQERMGGSAFMPRPTAAGEDSPVLRLLLGTGDGDTLFERLPEWYWTSPVGAARPGAEVLLERPTEDPTQPPTPIVALKRYGAGTVLFHGSDDTWRWRRNHGEAFFDAYWLQAIRHLAYTRKFPTPRGVVLRTDRTEASPHEPIVVNLTFEEQDHAAMLPEQIDVDIVAAGDSERFQLRLTRLGPGSRHYQGAFTPRRTGQLEIRFSPGEYALDIPIINTRVEVARRRIEYARPEANMQLMERLAALTAGSVVRPWEAAELARGIPARHTVVPDDVTETIWDSKLALLLFVSIIVMEWILRKRRGLT